MGRTVGFAAALACVLALTAGKGGAATDDLIVFPATPQGSSVTQLFAVRSNGDDLKQLTTGANPALDPALSPGGERVAYSRFGVGILTMNTDGSGLRRLTTNGRDAYPTWSPNGKKIAFVRPRGRVWRVYIVASTGGKPKPLSKAPPAGRPSWTKKGLLIPTGGDLLRIDTSTGHVLKYYGANIDAIWGLNSVALSPAVSLLTYVGAREPEPGDMECGEGPCQRFGLFLENLTLKRKRPRLIVKDTGPAVFSRDGKQIVYVAGGALVLRSVGSGQTTTVATGSAVPTPESPPAWR